MEIHQTKILGLTILFAGIALCGAGLWLLFSPAQYRATARIKVENDVTDISDMPPGSYYDPFFIRPILEKIQSPTVLSNVVASLKLDAEWGKKYDNGRSLETAKTIKWLQRRMQLEHHGYTKLIQISFSSEDPNEAARVANAIAKAYQDYRMEMRRQLNIRGLKALTELYQKEERDLKNMQDNFKQLEKQLNVPSPAPPNELLKSNYPSYFQAKQDLQSKANLHEFLASKIEAEQADLSLPRVSMVQIVKAGQAPSSPIGPNRILGAVLLVSGLASALLGTLLLKSSRHSTP